MPNRIRLKSAVKTREGFIIVPGVYDKESPTFPECLRDEDRDFLVEFLDPQPVAAVEENEEEDPEEDEDASEEGEESSDEEETSDEEAPRKKKKSKKKRA